MNDSRLVDDKPAFCLLKPSKIHSNHSERGGTSRENLWKSLEANRHPS